MILELGILGLAHSCSEDSHDWVGAGWSRMASTGAALLLRVVPPSPAGQPGLCTQVSEREVGTFS